MPGGKFHRTRSLVSSLRFLSLTASPFCLSAERFPSRRSRKGTRQAAGPRDTSCRVSHSPNLSSLGPTLNLEAEPCWAELGCWSPWCHDCLQQGRTGQDSHGRSCQPWGHRSRAGGPAGSVALGLVYTGSPRKAQKKIPRGHRYNVTT